jgi:hypothetical protein
VHHGMLSVHGLAAREIEIPGSKRYFSYSRRFYGV